MSNPIKEAFEISSIQKSIAERRKIIEGYQAYGIMDREDAIRKICELRRTDEEVLTITAANLLKGGRPFEDCPDSQLIGELKMQVDILEAELLKKAVEGKDM